MYTITDAIIAAFLIYFFLAGWSKGLLRSLLGPISLILGCLVAYIYYLRTQNLLEGLIISIVGPFVIHILFYIVRKLIPKSKKEKSPLFNLNHFLGGFFSLAWRGTILGLTLILIVMIPLKSAWIKTVQTHILNSQSYPLLEGLIGEKMPLGAKDIERFTKALEDPEQLKQIQSSKEYEAVMSDKKIEALLSDEETMRLIQEKNVMELINDPKMQAILKDKELVGKFLTLQKSLVNKPK